MSVNRPIVHLICTAHIDPVWMWAWEEGLREAISTFHTAADLLDEYPEFVFNHNESLLYEWIEEFDLPLFQRIQEHVKNGRWNITGGWYLQPDCNLPGGETLVRIILEGRRYFQQKFGERPPVAYNFDTFGHPASLPQLLKQSGFEFYIHCRPVDSQLELPANLYRWRGVDGSEVLAFRPTTEHGWYSTPRPGQPQEQARYGIQVTRKTGRDMLVLWGLGNHGGGGTRQDLEAFREMFAELADGDIEIKHSTPEAYLARVRQYFDELPVFEGELQRTLMGTYTSVAPIKREMRKGEALLASAERWATMAWWRLSRPYPAAKLNKAWKRLMFNAFHDVLCGSLLEDALPGVMDTYGYAHDTARRIIVKAQHALLPNVTSTPGTRPLYVFNPHSVPMQAPVGCNFLSDYGPPPEKKAYTLYDDTGQPVISQDSGGSSVILDEGTWQPFVGFIADIPPLSVRRYEIRFEEAHLSPKNEIICFEDDSGIRLESPFWRATFSRELGALVELVESSSGKNLLKQPLQLFAMHDQAHAWGGENNVIYNVPVSPFTALGPTEVGDFVGMEGHEGPGLRIIAQGPAWITVECLVGWQHTRASVRYTFYADLPYVDIDTRLYMQARRKMIKLVFPFDLPQTRAICEVPYGMTERPADATEYPYARWVRLESEEMTVGIANNGQNGLDVSADGVIGLSISRGATHCSWSEEDVPTDKSYTFMDQEQIDTHFRLLAGLEGETIAAQLIPATLELNHPFERFFTFYPPSFTDDMPSEPPAFLHIEPPTIMLGALKKSEEDEALIIRLIESNGQSTQATIMLENGPPQHFEFTPHEIKTLKITRQTNGDNLWQPCNLLEEIENI